jgi:hypothetical protein
MGFQISPGINVSEIDLTTIVPAVGTTIGAIAGPFRWGPANQRVLIDSELTLVSTFGKPDNTTASTWFTAANFLAYANALETVRVIKTGVGGHKNSTADGSGVLISNEDAYLQSYAGGQASVGVWAAKYPGDLGNSIGVSIADVNSFGTWAYSTSFTGKPTTSATVASAGGSNDELHIVVTDTLGVWTGVPGSILEVFPFLSKSVDAKSEDGSTIYYPEVINRRSKYVWWMDHPAAVDLGQVGAPNWGADKTTSFDTLSTKLTLSGPSGTFTVGEVVKCEALATITTAGSGAAATAVLTSNAVTSVNVTNGGTLYGSAPTVVFSGGGGTGATGTATVSGGIVTAVTVGNGGTGYTTPPTVSFVVPGSGATATVTVNSLGKITAVTPVANGTAYAVAPVVTITGPGSGATVTAVLGSGGTAGQVISYTVVTGGSGYTTVSATVLAWVTPLLTVAAKAGVIATTQKFVGVTSGAAVP